MQELLTWVEKLQTPGLILAACVIWWLFQLLQRQIEANDKLTVEVSENGKTLAKLAALMDLVCAKWLGRNDK